MRIVMFCHSLISDWNHGNAHFLRGIATELLARGHDVRVFEPRDAWSLANLLGDAGPGAIAEFEAAYPQLASTREESESSSAGARASGGGTPRAVITRFDPDTIDLDEALDGAGLVLVHEWSTAGLVERIGRHRAAGGRYVLLFHDTHHRSVTDSEAVAAYDLQHYDGVLAFGDVIRERYISRGWARRAWTWHEAADTTRFHPPDAQDAPAEREGDLVWVGNWGDDERSAEIRSYLIDPVRALGLRARIHGVRYPDAAVRELADAGIDYAGWLPNYRVPEVFARYTMTVHVPRRPYVTALPGIPTIRMFEALACGIPLVSCWWDDCEQLFRPGRDYLVATSPQEMIESLREIRQDPGLAAQLASDGLHTIRARHTCAHRVNELFSIRGAIQGSLTEKAFTV
jgi:spore maturation protein CgeB